MTDNNPNSVSEINIDHDKHKIGKTDHETASTVSINSISDSYSIHNNLNADIGDQSHIEHCSMENKGLEKHLGVTGNGNIIDHTGTEGFDKHDGVIGNKSPSGDTKGGNDKENGVNGNTSIIDNMETEDFNLNIGVIGNKTSNNNIETEKYNIDKHSKFIEIEVSKDNSDGNDDNKNGVIENTNFIDDMETEDVNDNGGVIGNGSSNRNMESEELSNVGVTDSTSTVWINIENAHTAELNVVAKEENESIDLVDPDGGLMEHDSIMNGTVIPDAKHEVKKFCKWQKELKRLGITDFKAESFVYDGCDNSDKVYRKYRLREGAKPNYRIPTAVIEPEIKTDQTINCETCNKIFSNNSELRLHIQTVHKHTYTCSLCSETFQTNIELVSHKSIHAAEKHSFLCHNCKLAFSDHCDYLLHEISHPKPNNVYNCPECSLSYGKESYVAHMYTHFNKPISCPICYKDFAETSKLKRHMHVHNTFECVECGKIMNEKSSFNAHMAIHTGVKIHQCLYCGKGFRLMVQLRVHTRIHTNERRFACDICDKRFVQATDMQKHMVRFHIQKEKEECPICKKKCWHLDVHMKVHTNEPLYQCPECVRKFNTVASLKAHVLYAHTTERTVDCKLCDKKFLTSSQFARHKNSNSHKRNQFKASLEKKV